MSWFDQIRRIRLVYDELPKIKCKGLCQQYCGPIACTAPEHTAMLAVSGRELGYRKEDFKCNHLDQSTGKCMVYEARPAICRLWGLTKRLQCPHGCVPDRWLSEAESRSVLDRIDAIAGENRNQEEQTP